MLVSDDATERKCCFKFSTAFCCDGETKVAKVSKSAASFGGALSVGLHLTSRPILQHKEGRTIDLSDGVTVTSLGNGVLPQFSART